MIKEITLTKIFVLNENIKFPKCYHCKKELSPYSISNTELKKLSKKTIENFVNVYLLYLNKFGINLHLLFICKHCLKGTFSKTNE